MKSLLKNKWFYIILFVFLIGVIVTIFLVLPKDEEVPAPSIELTPELLDQNIPNNVLKPVEDKVTSSNEATFDSSSIYDDRYVKYGLLVVENETGHIGFYSLHYNKYLIERQYYKSWVDYKVEFHYDLGYIVTIEFKDIINVYDCFGNVLYEDIYKIYDIYTVINEGILYLGIDYLIDSGTSSSIGYKYSENGTVTKVQNANFIKSLVHDDDKVVNESIFNKGDLYVDIIRMDLSKYGKEGYYLSSKENLFTVFDNMNKPINTFYIPDGFHSGSFINGYCLYQSMYELPDDADNYDISIGDLKYSIKTYRVNLFEKDKVDELELDFKINNLIPFKDLNGNYTLCMAEITEIDDYHIGTVSKYVIIDCDGNILEDISGLNPGAFRKLGDNYYNTKTQILYDSNLKEIAYLEDIDPVVDYETNTIRGRINGLYGVLDKNGDVLIPFEYNYITSDWNNVNLYESHDGIILGLNIDQYCFINLLTGNVYEVDGVLTRVANGLYTDISIDQVRYLDYSNKDELNVYYTISGYAYQQIQKNYVLTTILNDSHYFLSVLNYSDMNDEGNWDDKVNYYTFMIKKYLKLSISTIGYANNNFENDGKSIEFPHLLQMTDKPLGLFYTPEYSNYYAFTPEETGMYTLHFDSNDAVYINSVIYYKNNIRYYIDEFVHDNDDLHNDWINKRNYSYDLVGGVTYYFLMSNYTDKYFTYTLVKEDGTNIEAPLRIDLTDEINSYTFSGLEKYYRVYCTYDLSFNVNVDNCSVYSNDLYSDIIYIDNLNPTYITIKSNDGLSHSVTFKANVDEYIYGSSTIAPAKLNIGDAIEFNTYYSPELDSYRYFTYTNTTNNTVVVKLYLTGYSSSNSTGVYCSKESFAAAMDGNYVNNLSTYSIKPGETLYGVCTKDVKVALLGNSNDSSKIGYIQVINSNVDKYYSVKFDNSYEFGTNIIIKSDGSKLGYYDGSIYKFNKNEVYYIISYLPSVTKNKIDEYSFNVILDEYYSTYISTYNGIISYTCKVTFDSQGGSPVETQYVNTVQGLLYPEIPTKDGYIFAGWYEEGTTSSPYDFSKSIYSDINLYAKWIEYTGEEEALSVNTTKYDIIAPYQYGSDYEDKYYPFVPLVSGNYSFSASGTDSSVYVYLYDQNMNYITSSSRYYLYAGKLYYFNVEGRYDDTNASLTISYTTNNGMPYDGGKSTSYINSSGLEELHKSGYEYLFTAVPYSGYKFVGWYLNDQLVSTEEIYKFIIPNQNTVLYAKFELIV